MLIDTDAQVVNDSYVAFCEIISPKESIVWRGVCPEMPTYGTLPYFSCRAKAFLLGSF